MTDAHEAVEREKNMTLYCYEGGASSEQAAQLLSEAGIQFIKVNVPSDARSLYDLYCAMGIGCLPTLTMWGARYVGLDDITEYVDNERKGE